MTDKEKILLDAIPGVATALLETGILNSAGRNSLPACHKGSLATTQFRAQTGRGKTPESLTLAGADKLV